MFLSRLKTWERTWTIRLTIFHTHKIPAYSDSNKKNTSDYLSSDCLSLLSFAELFWKLEDECQSHQQVE